MKIKALAVLAVLFLGTLASAQTFGFASTGSGPYCNFEVLVPGYFFLGSHDVHGVYGGVDDLSLCFGNPIGTNFATISGIAGRAATGVQLPVAGPGVFYGDAVYAEIDGLPFLQWTVFTRTVCNGQYPSGQYKGQYGWVGVAGISGFLLGGNYGYLSCTVPPTDVATAKANGPIMGNNPPGTRTGINPKIKTP